MNKKTKKRVKQALIVLGAIVVIAVAIWLVYVHFEKEKLRDLSVTFCSELKNATCIPEEFSERPEDMSEEDIEKAKERVTELLSSCSMDEDIFSLKNDKYRDAVEINIAGRYRKVEVDYRDTISIKIYQDSATVSILVGSNYWTKFKDSKTYIEQLDVTFIRADGEWRITNFFLSPWDVVYE